MTYPTSICISVWRSACARAGSMITLAARSCASSDRSILRGPREAWLDSNYRKKEQQLTCREDLSWSAPEVLWSKATRTRRAMSEKPSNHTMVSVLCTCKRMLPANVPFVPKPFHLMIAGILLYLTLARWTFRPRKKIFSHPPARPPPPPGIFYEKSPPPLPAPRTPPSLPWAEKIKNIRNVNLTLGSKQYRFGECVWKWNCSQTQPWSSFPCRFGKRQGKPPKKRGFLMQLAEPLKSLGKKGKTLKIARSSLKRKKARKSKRARKRRLGRGGFLIRNTKFRANGHAPNSVAFHPQPPIASEFGCTSSAAPTHTANRKLGCCPSTVLRVALWCAFIWEDNKTVLGTNPHEDGNSEKLTMKKWWLFGCRFFHGLVPIFSRLTPIFHGL